MTTTETDTVLVQPPQPPTVITPPAPPSLGCDIMPQCFPEVAEPVLAKCDERRLSDEGKRARRQLVRLLVGGVDYDEYNAAMDALAEVELGCSKGSEG